MAEWWKTEGKVYSVKIDGSQLVGDHYFGNTCGVTFPDEQKEKEMKSLYEVFVVDLDHEVVQFKFVVVARTVESARMLAVHYGMGQGQGFPENEEVDLDDYDFIVHHLGSLSERE